MKRLPILCLTLVLLLTPKAGSAQFTISLLGGMNLTVIAQQVTDDIVRVGFNRVSGLNLGLAASYRLSPPDARQTLSVQLAGTYSEKGAQLGSPGIDYQMDYLEMALLTDMRFPLIVDGVFFHFLLGPALGWLMTCQRNHPATDNRPASSSDCDEGEFRDLDYAVAVGSGLEFALSKRLRITTSFLYTIGLGYIDHTEDLEGGSQKNRGLTFRADVGFPIG